MVQLGIGTIIVILTPSGEGWTGNRRKADVGVWFPNPVSDVVYLINLDEWANAKAFTTNPQIR
jgi:hypothetical protein